MLPTSRNLARAQPLALAHAGIVSHQLKMIDNKSLHASSFAIRALRLANEVGILFDRQQLQLHLFQKLPLYRATRCCERLQKKPRMMS